MKTPLGTEVDLGLGHIVLDGVPAPRERVTAAPFFSANVYCGHGRPSQLLLSSCYVFVQAPVLYFFRYGDLITSATDCQERLIADMIYYMLRLNAKHCLVTYIIHP